MSGDPHDPETSQGLESLSPSQELGSMASVLFALARTEAVTLAPGTLVADQYRIERPIGEGGMGVVFLARDVHLDRAVAVKVCTGLSSSAVHRIQREAIVLAELAHPNVVVLYQAGALLSLLGAAQQQLSRPDEAMATHREAIAFAERNGRGEHPGITAALLNLALVLDHPAAAGPHRSNRARRYVGDGTWSSTRRIVDHGAPLTC